MEDWNAELFFVGHRDAPETIGQALYMRILELVEQEGIAEFIVGHYGAFDRMAAEAVLHAKEKHSRLRLFLLTPYHPATRPVPCPDGFDGIIYPFERQVPP